MAFMEKTYYFGDMIGVEDKHGTVCLFPAELFTIDEAVTNTHGKDCYGDFKVSIAKGWYGRLSAPGYMDCTDWSGPYQTQKECEQELDEMYPEGEESEDARGN